jgi:hypothetical protein
VECNSFNGAFSCAVTPTTKATNTADTIIALDGFKWILQCLRLQINLKPALKVH